MSSAAAQKSAGNKPAKAKMPVCKCKKQPCQCKKVVVCYCKQQPCKCKGKPPGPKKDEDKTAGDKAKEKIIEAATAWAERAIRPVAPPPPPAVKVGDVVLKVTDPDRKKQFEDNLNDKVTKVINDAVDGAVDGMRRGVGKKFRQRGPVYAIWGAGLTYWVTEFLPLAKKGLPSSDVFQLTAVVFGLTFIVASVATIAGRSS